MRRGDYFSVGKDIEELATPGRNEICGLTFGLAPEGSPSTCGPRETVSLTTISALGKSQPFPRSD